MVLLSLNREVRYVSKKENTGSKLDIKSLLKEWSGLITWAFVLIQCWVHTEKLIWIGKKTRSDKSTWLRKTCPEEAVPATAQESTLWNHRSVSGRSKFQNYRLNVAAYWSLPNRTASALHRQFAQRRQEAEKQVLLQYRNYSSEQPVHLLHYIVHGSYRCSVSSKILHTPGL